MKVIDSHVHDWSADRARQTVSRGGHRVLHCAHPLADLTRRMAPDVVGVVLVSADQDSERENTALAGLSAADDLVVATIGYLNLHADNFGHKLQEAVAADSYFRGIRYTLRRGVDGPWTEAAIANARHLGGLGFLLEILASASQLADVADIAESLPEVPIVVDHIDTAPSAGGGVDSWYTSLAQVAALPNVTAKLSNFGIVPGPEVLAPCRRIVDLFGPERLMFASNWPVCLRYGSYDDVLRAAGAVVDELSVDARESIMYRTAARIFGVTDISTHEESHVRRR